MTDPYPSLKDDDRGQMDGTAVTVVLLVVGLMVGAIVAAFVLPIGIDALVDDKSTTITQSEGDSDDVGGINVTLDAADSTSGANYTLETDDDSATITDLTEGSNETVTLEGYDVNVTADNVTDTQATTTLEYPTEVGYSDGAQALWGILDVILVLAVFLFFIGVALGATNRV